MNPLDVIVLPLLDLPQPWCGDVLNALGERHRVKLFDRDLPVAPQFAGIDAVIDQGGSVGTREMMDAATETRLWQILGTGFEHFDLAYIKAKGVAVANCPGPFSAVALAETAMMYILMLSRSFHQAAENFKTGVLYRPLGLELEGRRLGIIGFGASGQELARRARGFGMRIHAIDVRPIEAEILEELQPEFVGGPEDMDQVIATSDFVSLHLHLNAETRHILNEHRIGLMKPSAYVINIARGGLIDEAALHRALESGDLGGAGLDVFSQEPPDPTLPVYSLPNVVVTPHTSGCTDGTSRKRAACSAENVDRVAQGLEPLYRIDL